MTQPGRPADGKKIRHPHLGLLIGSLLALLLVSAYLAGDYGRSLARIRVGRASRVESVHFQRQKVDFRKTWSLPVDALILDPEESGLVPEQLVSLRNKPDGSRRLVLAYLDVGQAEDYRPYWRLGWRIGSPSFIVEADPELPGRYRVKYWTWSWRKTMAEEVGRLAAAGFDGVVLDRVDAYGYWQKQGMNGAKGQMISLIREIRLGARRENPDFLIVPMNGLGLYGERRWQKLVDGLAKENTWYVDGHQRQPVEVFEDVQWLDQALGDGKFVLALDYPIGNSDVCDFYRMCSSKSYACAAFNRTLDLDQPLSCK